MQQKYIRCVSTPDIIGHLRPQAARAPIKGNEILSPTPPVLCLSTTLPLYFDQSNRSPLFKKNAHNY